MAESNPMRWVAVSLVASGLFVVGLLAFIDHSFDTAKRKAMSEVNAEVAKKEKRGTPMLDATASVAGSFVARVGGGHFAEAYALLAAPYRRAVPIETFAKTCRASAILTGARTVTLREVRQQNVGGASTLEARGLLDSQSGAVPIGFVFVQEQPGPRILVVSLAGVPVLQGVTVTGAP